MSWQNHPPPPHHSYSNAPPPHGGYGQPPPPHYSQPPAGGGYSQPPPHGGYNQGPPPGGYHGNPGASYGGNYGGSSQAAGRGYQQPPGGSYGPPPPAAGGGYGPPPGIDPTLYEWFKAVDADNSGQISAIELRQALVNSNWSHFNEETCRLLIGMFDKDKNGTIDIHEFGALWKYVQEWKGCFDRFDQDKSGNIDAGELQQALSAFGYRLSVNFCRLCTRVFDRADANSMKFDDFIQCCVMLRSLTESFQQFDTDRDGVIDVSYEQFLEIALGNAIS